MNSSATPVRRVRCPTCGGQAVYGPQNPWRPFCAERCRNHDLGAWASEGYSVPAVEPVEEDSPPSPALPARPPAH